MMTRPSANSMSTALLVRRPVTLNVQAEAVDDVAAWYELPRAGLRHQPLAHQQLDAAAVGFGYLGELVFEPSHDHEQDALVLAGQRMRSDLVGGHDPQLADGGVAGAGDHVGDAVGDVLGGEDLGLLVEGVDHLVADLGRVVRAQFGGHATRL